MGFTLAATLRGCLYGSCLYNNSVTAPHLTLAGPNLGHLDFLYSSGAYSMKSNFAIECTGLLGSTTSHSHSSLFSWRKLFRDEIFPYPFKYSSVGSNFSNLNLEQEEWKIFNKAQEVFPKNKPHFSV